MSFAPFPKLPSIPLVEWLGSPQTVRFLFRLPCFIHARQSPKKPLRLPNWEWFHQRLLTTPITGSNSRPNKRPYEESDNVSSFAAHIASPAKRNRSVLKETNKYIYRGDLFRGYDSDGIVMKKDVLKKSSSNIRTSSKQEAPRSAKVVLDTKVVRKKLKSTRKSNDTPLNSSVQRLVRRSVLPRVSSKSSDSTVLHKALGRRTRALYSSSPLRTSTSSCGESRRPASAATANPQLEEVPATWKFDIYEDSPAETMQNLMEHSATILDISDESDDEKFGHDEIQVWGKENVSPERMRDLMAGRETMELDHRTILPAKAPGPRVALADLDVASFYPPEEPVEEKKGVADISPVPELGPAFGLGNGADFSVWASEGESEDESDPAPLKMAELPQEPKKDDDETASICDGSDKEN